MVNPLTGWPGTIIEISGAGFSLVLDNNVVQVGGASPLVLEASASRLLVLADRATTPGPVTVTVSGAIVTGPEPLPCSHIRLPRTYRRMGPRCS
jgi:IPT/TIG domain